MDPRMMMQMGHGGPSQGAAGLASIFSGLFQDAGAPYDAAKGPYQDYMNKGAGALNPFVQGGQQGMGNYQHWLQGMQDPSGFMNHLMGKYQESPFAKYQQQQMMRAGQNAASAGGLSNGMGGAGLGSTPFLQQAQQNAQNISSGDMQNWLSKVLGINTEYGQGQQNMMGMGANSANSLSSLYQNYGTGMGNLAAGQQQGQNQNMGNIIGGIASLF